MYINLDNFIHLLLIDQFLRDIDPELSGYLDSAGVPAQIYGLRWSRLLLGREFPLAKTSHDVNGLKKLTSLSLWDYMFAHCHKEGNRNYYYSAPIRKIEQTGIVDPVCIQAYGSNNNNAHNTPGDPLQYRHVDVSESEVEDDPLEHVSVSSSTRIMGRSNPCYTPLVGILGDFMLAMLLHVRIPFLLKFMIIHLFQKKVYFLHSMNYFEYLYNIFLAKI